MNFKKRKRKGRDKEIKKRENSRTNLPVYQKAFPFHSSEDGIPESFLSADKKIIKKTKNLRKIDQAQTFSPIPSPSFPFSSQ